MSRIYFDFRDNDESGQFSADVPMSGSGTISGTFSVASNGNDPATNVHINAGNVAFSSCTLTIDGQTFKVSVCDSSDYQEFFDGSSYFTTTGTQYISAIQNIDPEDPGTMNYTCYGVSTAYTETPCLGSSSGLLSSATTASELIDLGYSWFNYETKSQDYCWNAITSDVASLL